jgi:hypothetical protein
MHRIFLISPANCAGRRAQMIVREEAQFDLARRLRSDGATLGEIFTFVSGLYFRGKLSYARAFARTPDGSPGTFIITANRGLLSPDTRVTLAELRALGSVQIDARDARYAEPLRKAAARFAALKNCEVVLLGSIATGKYVDHLLPLLGDRLRFPGEFVGRGDMSRGGLMLRCIAEGRELEYLPVAGAVRHGPRPPKLAPLRV